MAQPSNEPEATVVNMTEHLGKRGFILVDNTTVTVTVIAVGDDMTDQQSPDEVEVITAKGERLAVKFDDITFDEPAEATPAPVQPQAPAVQQPDAPRALTLRDTAASSLLDPNVYMQMKAISKDFFESRAVPSAYQNIMQVLFGLQAGYEMGMQPVESLQSLTIVNGTISLWGKAVPKRLRLHGWSLKFEEGGDGDDQYCQATITKGEETYTDKVSFKDAEQSGYTTDNSGKLKIGWKPGMNRRLKLRYDVLDVLCKTYVPEVFGPAAGTAEVLQDVNVEENATPSVNDQIEGAVSKVKLDTKAKVKNHENTTEGEVVGGDNASDVPTP